MIKNSINHKGVEIIVVNNTLRLEKDNKQVAICNNFLLEENLQMKDNTIAVKLTNRKDFLKKFGWMGLSKEQYQELLNIKRNIELEIENYFKNIENAELYKLSGNIYFKNENKELEELNENLYRELKKEWIAKNKQYFIEVREIETSETGMNSTKITYTFTKENKEVAKEEIAELEKTEEYQENQKQIRRDDMIYQDLHKLANKVSDEEFEDRTGRFRKDFL